MMKDNIGYKNSNIVGIFLNTQVSDNEADFLM